MTKMADIISEYAQIFTEDRGDYRDVSRHVKSMREAMRGAGDCSGEIGNALVEFTRVRDGIFTHIDLWLMAAELHPSEKYVDSLGELLALEGEGIPHEMIVDVYESLASPRSIPCLANALRTHSVGQDGGADEVALRCVDALVAIDTDEAWDVIQAVAQSPSAIGVAATACLASWK